MNPQSARAVKRRKRPPGAVTMEELAVKLDREPKSVTHHEKRPARLGTLTAAFEKAQERQEKRTP